MEIMAIALGGCVAGDPKYGITEDTGGHITYLLGAMKALVRREDVECGEIVTRLFDEPALGHVHSRPSEEVVPKLSITRLDSGDRRYLAKEDLARDRAAFTAALLANLRARERLPDVIHAHFADAADIALRVRDALGIPFIYTPHSLALDKLSACNIAPSDLRDRIAEEDRAIAGADAVIGSSRDECERQILAYPSAREDRVWRVRPGIEQRDAAPHEIAAARESLAPFLRDPGRPMILAIARPVAKKNLAVLVEAYAADAWLRAQCNLVILPGQRISITSGEAEQVRVIGALVDAIDRHDLHGSVAYPRQHDGRIVRGLYALARETGGVFVNPALTEPFGLTTLEAALHGVPMVATRNGGPADMVRELGHGVLVDPLDPAAIGNAIRALITDHATWEACSRSGRRTVRSMRWENYAAQFVRVARTLGRSPTRPLMHKTLRHLLVCDIDNTLTGCRPSAKRLTRFVEARNDTMFGVATGRSLIEARRILGEWQLPTPRVWITSVGSEIYWQDRTGLTLDEGFAERLAQDWDPDAIVAVVARLHGAELQPGIEQRRFKRSWFVDDRGVVAQISRALEDAGLNARVVFSHARLLDILPAAAGKGAAVLHVAEKLGVPLDQVVVAGDSGNDLDMIEACPNAIVVGNSEAELAIAGAGRGAYLARRDHAGGVHEGLVVHMRRRRGVLAWATA